MKAKKNENAQPDWVKLFDDPKTNRGEYVERINNKLRYEEFEAGEPWITAVGNSDTQRVREKTLVEHHKELIDSLIEIDKKIELLQRYEPVSLCSNHPLHPHQHKMLESYRNVLCSIHQEIFEIRQFQTGAFLLVLDSHRPKMPRR